MCKFRYLLVLFFLQLFTTTSAQQSSTDNKRPLKLLYYVNDANSSQFLVPFIETYLQDLYYPDRKLAPVYSEVISLNMLFENRKIEGKIIDAFIYADRRSTTLQNSKERDKRDAAIANSLSNYDRFLVVKINPFNTLLEFQFLMYDVIRNTNAGVKDMPVLKSYRSSSVFIDPMSKDCREHIAFSIRQVCPEVNETPVAQIQVNKKTPRSLSDTVYIKKDDTLNLFAVAVDTDSPKERFTYSWTVSRESLYGQLFYGKPTQRLVADSFGVFNIGLTAGDGISQSAETGITVKVIDAPILNMDANGGNMIFFGDLFKEIGSRNLNEIRDDVPQHQYENFIFLFINTLWGRRLILAGEDSVSVYFSKGDLRVKQSNASDSVLESTIDVTAASPLDIGQRALIRFYPEKKLQARSYHYTFYADEKGVVSPNLNLRVSFVKMSQLSLFKECTFGWLGSGNGTFWNAVLGVGWRPFGFMQINYGASWLFGASAKVQKQEGNRIINGQVNSRLILELMNHKKFNLASVSFLMQQFRIASDKGKRTDYLWGLGLRTAVPMYLLGSRIIPTGGLHYFPNFNKRSYLSGAGMLETYLGLRMHFFVKR